MCDKCFTHIYICVCVTQHHTCVTYVWYVWHTCVQQVSVQQFNARRPHLCMHVRTYTYLCTDVCMYVCMCQQAIVQRYNARKPHLCMYVRTYVFMYVRTYVCLYVSTGNCATIQRPKISHKLNNQKSWGGWEGWGVLPPKCVSHVWVSAYVGNVWQAKPSRLFPGYWWVSFDTHTHPEQWDRKQIVTYEWMRTCEWVWWHMPIGNQYPGKSLDGFANGDLRMNACLWMSVVTYAYWKPVPGKKSRWLCKWWPMNECVLVNECGDSFLNECRDSIITCGWVSWLVRIQW